MEVLSNIIEQVVDYLQQPEVQKTVKEMARHGLIHLFGH